MKKIFFTILVSLLFLVVTAFNYLKENKRSTYIQQPNAEYTVPENKADDASHIPSYGKTYLGFKEAIGFKESQNRYHIVNTLGYLGKYQFGKSTLSTLRIHNIDNFLYNAELQEKAFKANCSYNKWLLKDEIKQYVNTTVKGIHITESGMLAAAHLAGAGSVKRYLRSKGRGKRIIDAYGTGIEQYFVKFANYDLSSIEATKYPTL